MTAGPGTTASYGWRLGEVRGVPVYIGRSWPIIAIIVVITFAPKVSSSTGERGGVFGYAVALAYAVLLLVSVLAHEAGHALVARRFGYQVDRVVADLWGGHTVYDSSSSRPGTSAAISVSGPVANLLLAAVGFAAPGGLEPDGVVGLLLYAVTLTNAFVGVFNLLPGLPLDGGFLVHALVWKVTGDRNRALIVAGWLGRVVTVVVVLWVVGRPLLLGQPPSLFTIIWCGLIGAFLWMGATNAIRAGQSRRVIERVPLSRVLRPALVVGVTDPVASVLARADGAASGGRYRDAVQPGVVAPVVAPVVVVVGRDRRGGRHRRPRRRPADRPGPPGTGPRRRRGGPATGRLGRGRRVPRQRRVGGRQRRGRGGVDRAAHAARRHPGGRGARNRDPRRPVRGVHGLTAGRCRPRWTRGPDSDRRTGVNPRRSSTWCARFVPSSTARRGPLAGGPARSLAGPHGEETGTGRGGPGRRARALGVNEVRLVGRVSGPPESRELPSGDIVVQLRVVVGRPPSERKTQVDTIDVSCWTATARRAALRQHEGDVVEVTGALRRRFFRAGATTQSRYDVEAVSVRRHQG